MIYDVLRQVAHPQSLDSCGTCKFLCWLHAAWSHFCWSAIDFPDVAEAARKSRTAEFATWLRQWEGGGGRQRRRLIYRPWRTCCPSAILGDCVALLVGAREEKAAKSRASRLRSAPNLVRDSAHTPAAGDGGAFAIAYRARCVNSRPSDIQPLPWSGW